MAVVRDLRPSYRPYIFMFLLNLAIVAGILYFLRREEPRQVVVTQAAPRASNSNEGAQVTQITVLVSGAVKQPGTLRLESTARLADALQKAGGVRTDADLSQFDLTRSLKQGETINVPARGANPSIVNNLVVGTPTARSIDSASVSQKINLNTATLAQLESLPGIGPALAQRILDYRAANGDFETIAELKEVKGIGDVIFQELEKLITVSQNGE